MRRLGGIKVKTVILYNYEKCRHVPHYFGWSIEEIWDDFLSVYSEPFYVEIPDDFYIGETITCEKMFFKENCDYGYELCTSNGKRNQKLYLVGGSPVEKILLNVLDPVPKDEQ